jgi:AbrB family looped-hinge helix DNA binding protein
MTMIITIPSDFCITIPESVREQMKLYPGQRLAIFVYDNRLQLVPVMSLDEARGFLKGMDTSLKRDEEDRV